MRKFSSLFLSSLILCGCFPEDDATIVSIYAYPSTYEINCGEKMYIDVNISTLNENVESVMIKTFDPQYGNRDIFSANPCTKTFKERIIYDAPYMEGDTTNVEFMIQAADNTGKEANLSLMIKVCGDDGGLLPEMSSIVIYSPLSGKNDAFSFENRQTVSTATSNDVDMHVISDMNSESFSPGLATKTDIVFSLANNYDYSAATWSGLQSFFQNSTRVNQIDKLDVDSIIIVGREERTDTTYRLTTLGVLKTMAIYDDAGTSSDRIVFNLKAL